MIFNLAAFFCVFVYIIGTEAIEIDACSSKIFFPSPMTLVSSSSTSIFTKPLSPFVGLYVYENFNAEGRDVKVIPSL